MARRVNQKDHKKSTGLNLSSIGLTSRGIHSIRNAGCYADVERAVPSLYKVDDGGEIVEAILDVVQNMLKFLFFLPRFVYFRLT